MQQKRLIVGIDLGTASATASHVIVNDSFTPEGRLHRERGRATTTNIRDWPGGNIGDATGKVCVPTDLIYEKKAHGKLLYWGYRAQQYQDDPYPDIHPNSVFIIEHIKLLLQDHNDVDGNTVAMERYRALRRTLIATLRRRPEEIFEDFLNEIITHVIGSAHRKYFHGICSTKIELLLAFPSGWPDYLHTMVAKMGSRAMIKALEANNLQNMTFAIENVYTVSETLCGIKEWLRDTIADTSNDPELPGTNLDELNVCRQYLYLGEYSLIRS